MRLNLVVILCAWVMLAADRDSAEEPSLFRPADHSRLLGTRPSTDTQSGADGRRLGDPPPANPWGWNW